MGPWGTLLLLLLLLGGSSSQEEGAENQSPTCPRDTTRFKHLRKYVYNYEAESANSVAGTADSHSATRINCKVELEVPQLCRFILKMSQCTLKEVYGFDPDGKALLRKTKNSDEFAAAMARDQLRLSIPDGKQVLLYPEKGEPAHILNIKRGVVSALLVPMDTEEDQRLLTLDTVYGNCSSDVTVRARKGNVATEILINRNLEKCDGFKPISKAASPIALIKGLGSPLSKLLSSQQECVYTLDPRKKHVVGAVCKEQHLFLPFSYKNQYGMMAHITQTLKLEDTPKTNSRFFDEDAFEKRGLALESSEAAAPTKEGGEVVLKTLEELQKLSALEQNEHRAKLFSRLVTGLRALNEEAFTSLWPKLLEVSSPLALQALVQCGQPHCYSHILHWLKTEKVNPLLIDAASYIMALTPNPSAQRLREIFKVAQERPSRITLYALSHVVNKFHRQTATVSQELKEVTDYLISRLGNECSGSEEAAYLTLRVIGNMGRTLEEVSPELKASLLKCIQSPTPSLSVQKAAIQALRKMELTEEVHSVLLQTFLDSASPEEKRLAAYLLLMRQPTRDTVHRVIPALLTEKSEQVRSFVVSHIANILVSEDLSVQDLRSLVKEALQDSQLPAAMDFRRFSQNYQFSKAFSIPRFSPFSTKVEGNLLFDPHNYLPKETMLKTTLSIFGFHPTDLFEVGLEGKGYEPTLEALFGKQGFFPDSATKALYWVDGRVPDPVSKVLVDHFGYTKEEKRDQDMVNGLMLSFQKLLKDLGSREAPEAQAYLRILGEELGYVRLEDFKVMGTALLRTVKSLQGLPQMIAEALTKGSKNDLFVHYIFMENTVEFPTGVGLPLQLSTSGLVTPGVMAGVKLQVTNMQAELVAKPSVSVEFVTHLGVTVPDFAWSGVQMNSNLYHESGLEARVALTKGQLKFAIPAPKNRVKLFKASNTLHLVSTSTYSKGIPPLIENRRSWSDCRPLFRGLNYCSTLAYSNASSIEAAPYYPLTGDTRFELELQPTGDVEEYTALVNYELQGEGRNLVDQLRFAVQAEGPMPSEATLTFKYHRSRMALTSDLQVPDLEVDLGTSLRIRDQSDEENVFYSLTLDVQDRKTTEATFTGHIRCDRKAQGTVGIVLSVPFLQAEARSETLVHRSSKKLLIQMDSSATALGTTVSKKVAWRYDEKKLEFEWNMGTNTETKKLASRVLTEVSKYRGSLHQYSQDWLDRKVAHTDMTIRHIGSKLIAATNTWFQKASQGLPYAETLQRKLQSVQEWEMPEFQVPDNLFLKSDGRVRYTLNKNHVKVEIPLLFGGKSLEQLQLSRVIRTSALDLQAIGLQWPARELKLPPLTIPKSYPLKVPLLGILELSTNVYSNLYNWSASYTGGNTTADTAQHVSFQSRYHMKANSALSLFSYSLQGSGETTYDHGNTFTLSCDGSLHHKFLDSNLKLSHVEKFGNNPASKGFLTLDASSGLGPQVSFSVHFDSKRKLHLYVKEIKADGQLRASSFHTTSTYALSYQRDVSTGQISGESNLRLDSSFFQATNQVIGRYGDGSLSVTSVSNLQDGGIKNTASLTYENSQLTLKSDTTGKYSDLVAAHKLDLTLARQSALLRSEYQVDFQALKVFTLLSGSLNSRGLELNADLLGTDQSNSGAHKATVRIGQDGVSTSATTNLKILPLMVENELNAALGPLGASLKVTTHARYQEHSAKYTLDGKAALTEVALGSVYQATILGTDSKDIFNFRINKEGLTLSNDMVGSYKETKLEHVNNLVIAGWSLDFTSEMENILSQNKLYQQSFSLQLQPYFLSATLNNNLRYGALDLANTGKLRLEPLKLSLGGNVKGTYGKEEIKHIYSLTYANLSASYKMDAVGKVRGAELTHRVSANLAGLASSIDINTAYNSESLRFSNIFRAMMEPFVLAVDAHTTGNGHLVLGGKHTGQLYSKFLLKAEPLALTFSHDCKASSGHQLRSQRSIETTLDHKVNALLTPAEQSSTWKLKALANKNEYNHDLQAYNTKDRVGMELRAGAAADLTVLDSPIELPSLFNEPINVIDVFDLRTATDKPQEFSLIGSIKYDKNLNVHVINLPFLESLPAYFEKVRGAVLATLQDLQRYLKSINIDHYVKQYRVALDKLPHLVNNLLVHFNFEGQVINAKEKLITFMENHKITVDDLQISLANAKIRLNEIVSQLQTYLIQFDQYIKDNYDLHKLKESIIELINKLKVFEENYKIHYHVMRSIQEVYEFLEKINVNKIRLMVWLRAQILEKLQQLNQQIQNIDFQYWADWLKGRVEDIDVRVYIEFLRTSLPIQELNNIVERIKEIVMNLLEDYEVIEKINAFRAKIHELTHKYEVHKRVQALLDKLVQLANQYKLKETTQKLTNSLKKMEIKAYFEKLRTLVDKAVKKAQTAKFEQLIDEVNKFLDLLVKTLRSFDYNQFVDEANKTIRELIQNINEEIQALELPQKIKAAKLYAAEVRAMLADYLDKIKDTQLTVIADWFWDVMSSASVIDVKGRFQEILEDTRDRLYKLDIQREIQHGLQTISQVYNTLVTYIWDWWMLIAKELTDFAEQYHVKDWAESVKRLVEHGFSVPEIKTALGTLPAFEVSLRALQEATFRTPDFMVPLTDLRIPSTQINIKKLKEIRVASQFTTPEFSILNTFVVPSFTIDLIEIKLKIIRTIDQIMSSEFRWPLPEISLQDLKVKDTLLAALTLPDFHLPEVTIPEIVIPKLSLNEFQVPDIQIPEFQLPRIPHTVVIPTFGKVSAALKITSSLFTLDASGFIENTTTSERSPEILASVAAQGQSPVDLLDFTFQADAHFSAPEMERLVLKESLELSSKYLKAEHDSEMVFLGTSILGKVNTLANIHTDKNTMELGNSLSLKLEKQVTLDSNTKYSHKLNLPQADFSSQMDLRHELRMLLVLERVAVTSTGTGSWKWAFPHFSDEGTHESLLRFTVEGPVASLDMSNTINSKHVKVNQKLASESGFLNFAKFEIQSEVQSQHVGQSVLKVRGSAMLGEMKAELMGTHDANLNGRVTGTLRNSLSLVVQPFEVGAEVNNEGNVKVSFPLKLTGKIDFLNNYALVLSCDMQQVSWQSGARFNQYRYSQNFSAGNDVNSLEAHVSINGEANLDFLNVPLTIPEMNLPYTKVTTPPLRDFSLWERTGLKDFLKTTKQSFDLSVNAQYKKNRDSHSILFPLGAVYDALSPNINVLHQHFEKGRDKTLDFLTKSYNETKVKFEKHKVEASLDKLPRTLRIPGYYIPVLNIEVCPFTAELPAFGYMVPKETSTPAFTIPGIGFSLPSYTLVLPSLEFPVLYVPASLQKLSLPDFKIPRPSDHILIPAMGNLTYDFSFKSSAITLSTNMGLYNKSDIVAHFRSSSFSVIDALQYKLDGTTSLTRKRGLKLATALSLNNKFVEGNHDSTISLTKKNMEASVTTTAKVQCPVLRANFQQELSGNMKSKPIISSIIKLKYNFTSAQLHSSAKGAIDHQLTVESFIPYLSIETATKGSMSGSVLSQKYSGAISSEANSYLDTKSMRSSMKLEGTSKVDGIWNVEAKENFAGEASVGHIYTVWEHNGKNHLQLRRGFSTSGEQNSKVTLELAPWTASSVIQVQVSQPSNLFKKASLGQVVTLTASLKDQRAGWKGEGHIQTASFSHNIQLSNDPSEIRLDVASSLEGYMSFLKDALLPVYDTSLWDILKLDVTTSADRKQYLHISSALFYTKNPTGYQFSIPVKETADEFIIPGPELKSLVTPASSPESSYIRLAKKTIMAPFALSLPSLPQVKFPRVEVSTEYSTSEGSTLPFFGVTVPEFQVTLSSFTLPKKLPLAGAILDLNELANKIADFDLPSITMSEQSISVPTLTFWLPTGIFLPSFGALTGNFQAASPVYNTSWSANLKRKEDRLETTLEATCSSTMQLLQYDLDYGATYAFEDNVLVGKMSGRFSHRELRAEYEDLLKVQGLKILEETKTFKVTSPTFTNVLMNYQQDGNNFSLTISSPPIGTLGLDFQGSPQVLQGKIYHHPTVSPERKLALVEMVLSQQSPEALQLSMSWNEETASELVQTLRAALHRAGETLYLYVDKCHREQTGLDIGSASSKLRKLLQKRADEAYHGALNQIDEAESGLRQAAGKAASTFQQWEDSTQRLYQAEQADFWDLKNKAFDGALGLTQEYHKKTLLLMDSGIELLQANRFQLPGQAGGYSGDELCSAVLREAGKALSRAYSTVHQAVEALISYVKDLDEKAAFLDLQKGLVELGERLEGFSDNVQHRLNGLQAAKFSDILISLQSFADRVFQQIEESITVLKEKTFASLKNEFLDGAGLLSDLILRVLRYLRENLRDLNSFVLTQFQEISRKLSQFHNCIKTLWEEYFDPNIIGWTVKYYEIEDKLINLARKIIDALKDFHSNTFESFLTWAAKLTDEVERLANTDVQKYLDLLRDADRKGKERLHEASMVAQESISQWASAAKRKAANHREQFLVQLQGTSDGLSQAFQWATDKAVRLISLSVQGCHALLKYVAELLHNLRGATASRLNTYVQVHPGQLMINVPYRFH